MAVTGTGLQLEEHSKVRRRGEHSHRVEEGSKVDQQAVRCKMVVEDSMQRAEQEEDKQWVGCRHWKDSW